MAKRIAVFCDGTWNVPDQESDGHPSPTNVTKLALSVAERGADGMQQSIYYHRGVGTTRRERVTGGAFGFGLSRNVRDAYRFIVETFEDGDEIFLLGFSRGAFTARSTAGFIRNTGVLRREHIGRLDDAYRLYRARSGHPRGVEATLFRRSFATETPIRFIGVWDTVGALGIPMSGLRWANAFNRRWQFHDTELSTTVAAAFHALAIDEKRKAFAPTIWKRQAGAGDQRLEQVWFTGVHCDVGGGYSSENGGDSLSDIALLWMAARAQECGLTLRHDKPDAATDPMGRLHNSRKGFYRVVPAYDRPIGATDPPSEYAADTAVTRRRTDPSYEARNLDAYLDGSPQIETVG